MAVTKPQEEAKACPVVLDLKADSSAGREGARMCFSIPKTLPVLLHGHLGKIPAFPAAATGLYPGEALGHKPASGRAVAGAFPKRFPFAHTLKGRGRMGALRAAQPPWAGAVHAPAASLPKETQTSYPKKALFIGNTGSHFCKGLVCSGQLSPPHCQAELSGLGSGQSRPSCPTLEPQKAGRVTTSGTWRGFRLTRCETPRS